MKKLPFPLVDDLSVLSKMKNNTRLNSQPYIVKEYQTMISQYNNYTNNKGNPWTCSSSILSKDLKEHLIKHYKRPYTDLLYIRAIRENGSPDVCPMCGSLSTTNVDHYLPKEDYPEWAIFSRNLVPACDCNIKRSTNVKGTKHSQRVLHPYFDNCLQSRLVMAEFSGNLDRPMVTLIPIYTKAISLITIQFHINTVIAKTSLIKWMESKWQSMSREPRRIITSIPKNAKKITMAQLEDYLQDILECTDLEHGTPNNWYSMFFYGIQQSNDAMKWLLDRHNAIVSGDLTDAERFD